MGIWRAGSRAVGLWGAKSDLPWGASLSLLRISQRGRVQRWVTSRQIATSEFGEMTFNEGVRGACRKSTRDSDDADSTQQPRTDADAE